MDTASTSLWHELYLLEIRHWRDVNLNEARRAHEFYVEDGLFAVGDTRHQGREAIRNFYSWRRSRGARVSRHIVENFFVEEDSNDVSAVASGVICLFAADGVGVLESRPPTMIADLRSDCMRGSDGLWRYTSHVLKPIFRGEGRLQGDVVAR
jgi:hypothetical protein